MKTNFKKIVSEIAKNIHETFPGHVVLREKVAAILPESKNIFSWLL